MAEPVPLHDRAVQLALQLITAIWSVISLVMTLGIALDRGDPRWLAILAAPALMILIFRNTLWRAQPVRLQVEDDGSHLHIGRGKRQRRVPLTDVLEIGRPWWAWPDKLFVPLELVLRDGPQVLFFPIAGAEDLLRARRDQARQAAGRLGGA